MTPIRKGFNNQIYGLSQKSLLAMLCDVFGVAEPALPMMIVSPLLLYASSNDVDVCIAEIFPAAYAASALAINVWTEELHPNAEQLSFAATSCCKSTMRALSTLLRFPPVDFLEILE